MHEWSMALIDRVVRAVPPSGARLVDGSRGDVDRERDNQGRGEIQ